jgi:CSLREA domain-containing protein
MKQTKKSLLKIFKPARLFTAAVTVIAIFTIAPGANAAGFSLLDTVSEFFGWQNTGRQISAAKPAKVMLAGRSLSILNDDIFSLSETDGTSVVLNPAVSQNFNAMTATATAALPADFKVDKNSTARLVGSYGSAATATELLDGASVSTSAANGIYNFGSGTTDTGGDRAIGWLSSGTATKSGNLYVQLTNNTGSPLSGLTISYDVEKYRNGQLGYRIQMYYSTDGTNWTSAGGNFLTSFSANINNNGFTTAPGSTTPVSNQALNQSITTGGTFYLAWNYSVTSGSTTTNAQALAVDNISISPVVATPGTVAFDSTSYTDLEGATKTITVNRTGGSLGAISVDFTTGGGTATGGAACTAGVDYISKTGTLNWADGNTAPKTFDVQLCTDALTETDGLNLTLSNPVGTTITGANPVPLNITDNFPGTIQLFTASQNADENLPSAGILVSRTGGSAGSVSVDYAPVAGGTATIGASCTAGVDYVLAPGTLTWASMDSADKFINVQLCTDLISYEGPETAIFNITNVQGGAALGSPTSATLTINDRGATFFNSTALTIPVFGPADLYPSNIDVAGVPGAISNLRVTLFNVNHTFPDDMDILLVGPGGQKFILMSDAGDNPNLVNRTFTFADTAASFMPDAPGTAIASGTWKPTNYGTGDTFGAPAPDGPYSTPGPDGSDTLNGIFGGADPNGTWSLYVFDAFNPDGGTITAGWGMEITTTPPAPGTAEFSSAAFNENEGAVATINVKRVAGGLGAMSVDYATSNGSATGGASCGAGVDFINTSGTLNWADADTLQKSFTVKLCSDALTAESTETVSLTLSNVVGGTGISGANPAALNIVNNDFGGSMFSNHAAIAIPEAGTATPYPSTITVSGMNGSLNDIRVKLNNFNHTYSSDVTVLLVGPQGQKFTPMSGVGSNTPSNNLNFRLYDGASDLMPVGALTSGPYKPTSTFFTSDLPAPAPGNPYATPASAGTDTFLGTFGGTNPNGVWSLYVYDQAGPDSGSFAGGWDLELATASTVSIDQTNYLTTENAGTFTVNVVRDSTTGPMTVDYSTGGGVAVNPAVGGASCGAGVDYINTSGTLNFGIDEASKTFDITLCDDAVYDGLKTIHTTISNPTGGFTIGGTGDFYIFVNDNDPAPALSIGDVTVNEGDGTATFVITESFASAGNTSFLYSTSDITATAGSDYTGATNANGIILAGETTANIVIPITQDNGFEDAETFQVVFSGAPNITDPIGIGTIVDDDIPAQYTVTSLNNSNDGNCNATHCSLREAMNASNANPGVISFAPGLTGTITLTGSRPQINGNTVINGPGANVITVSGNNLITPFDIPNANTSVTIKGITITNGRNMNSGQAGAINNGGDLTIVDSVITASRGSIAGAIQNYTKLTIRNSTISNNIGGTTDPECASVAGGIDMSSGSATIINSTISGNSVSTNCSANSGAINIYAGAVILNHCTVTNNSSSDNSAAITNTDITPVKTFNSIIAGNHSNTAGPDVGGQFTSNGFNLIGSADTSSGFGLPTDQMGSGASLIDPMLGGLTNNGGTTPTHALLAGSPAIDQGNGFGVTTDQRGVARPIQNQSIPDVSGGDGSDIGAFEVSNPAIQILGGPLAFPDTQTGSFSAEQTYTLSGSGLEGSIAVTAPADFQVSKTSGSGFGPSVTFAQTSGYVIYEPVYVRFAPASDGAKSENIANSASNATTQNVPVSGNAIHLPSPGMLQFSSAAYSDNETDADHAVNIIVTRTGGSDGAVSVGYAVTDSTATVADNDYSATASGTLNWADGDSAAKNIVITVKGDLTVEPDETVNVALSNITGGAALGSPSTAVLTITNDDVPPVIYLVNVNDDTNDGNCDATHCSLREAIGAVNVQPGDINFAPNVTGEIVLLSSLPLLGPIYANINGPGAGVLTVKRESSVSNVRILAISGGNINISGLTFDHGAPNFGGGGGIYNFGDGTINITNCAFTNNVAVGVGRGGAVYHYGAGHMTITGSTFINNQADIGGAIANDFTGPITIINSNFSTSHANTGGTLSNESSATMTLTNVVIDGSTSTFQAAGINVGFDGGLDITDSRLSHCFAGNSGGAIFNTNTGVVNITRSTLSENSATSVGGGMYNNTGTVNITASTISGNTVTSGNGAVGAGLYNNGTGTYNVTNSTISGNSSSGNGGGIRIWSGNGIGHANITSSTISGNGARFGGGIDADTGADIRISNTIVAGNIASQFSPDIYGTVMSMGYNIIGNNQFATVPPLNGDQIGTPGTPINPHLGPLQDNGGPTFTHELLTGSPGIDTGEAFGLITDQRGLTRPSNKLTIANISDGSDIGAYELQAPSTPTISVDDTVFGGDTLVPNAFTVSLSNAHDLTVTVHYATADDTAQAGEDYVAKSGTLIFAPGETTKTVPVSMVPDTTNEGVEQFFLNLDMPVNGTIADGQGIGTIFDDDPQATIAIDDVTHVEGNSGTTTYTFTVTKAGVTDQTVAVDYATFSGSAIAPSDFGTVSGTLTFTPAETLKTVTVNVNGDANFEADEAFYVRLTNPVAVDIIDGEGVGNITNDDAATVYIINVNADTDDGVCDATNCSLREAINAANATGGHINFAPNVTGSISLLSALPAITNSNAIVINGPGANVLEVKRDAGAGAMRIFDINGGGVYTISGLAINDGDVRPIGGAFNNLGGAIRIINGHGVTINNCTFTNNWANNGAAIYNGANPATSPLTVNGSTFTANNANQSGGGIENRFSNTVTVNHSTFDANGANNFGGGIHNIAGGVMFISDSLFTGNAANSGAAIYNDDNGSITINRSNFITNHAQVGGAMGNKDGGLDVFNSTLSGNISNGDGGAASNRLGTIRFFNSTLSGNTSGNAGGAVYFTFEGASNGTFNNCTIVGNHAGTGGGLMVFNGQSIVRVGNTIMAGNSALTQAPELYGQIYSSGYNIFGKRSNNGTSTFNEQPTDIIGSESSPVNPVIGSLADNGGPTKTHALLAGSPAIDSGNPFGETADQRGYARVVNGTADRGAFEIQNAPTQISTFSGTPQTATVGSNYAPLKARVLDVNNDPVGGVTVTFNAPNAGASGNFPGAVFSATAVTDDNGVATAPVLTANNTAGSFQVSAGYAASPLATFDLTNLAQPTLSVDDVTFTGADSLVLQGFTVTLSAASAQTVTVHYQTADGTAFAGEDYTAVSGTLTFDPGQTEKSIPINILPDTVQENTEQFFLNLDSPSGNVAIADGQGVGTIPNDDAAPTFAIDDVTQNEGNSGTSAFTFTITRTGNSALSSTVNYTTNNASASSVNDYVANTGSVMFLPNETTKQVGVIVNGDTSFENTETFTLDLIGTDNGTFTDNSGLGTITNDDAAPAFSIDDVTMNEGNGGPTAFTFTVTKSGTTALESSIALSVADGTATQGSDHNGFSGLLTFLPNEVSKTAIIVVNGDTVYENDETFFVNLFGPSNATIGDGQGLGTIINDDSAPSFSIDPVTHNEGDSGTTAYTFTVTKTGATALDASVNYNTLDGNATVGDGDYTHIDGMLTFLPSDTTQTFTVLVNGDTKFESDEQFIVQISNPVGATISHDVDNGHITNDDTAPSFSIDDVTHSEGNSGTTAFTFTVTKTGESGTSASVDFETQDGTATIADNDYQSNSGTLTFLPADTTKTITVLVNGNYLIEPDENFTLHLSNPNSATISDTNGTGTIANDDNPPAITYVDDDWAALSDGTDPDGAGPALAIGYDAFDKIQEGIDAVTPSGAVNVYAGTYDEDVAVTKAGVQLLGAGAGSTNIRGPINGPGTTVQIAASNTTVAGFTITRLGNNTTDWNNPGLNTAGVAIQGQSLTGAVIHDNILTGNRTAIDINNSNGHTVRNNVIDFNYTGIIFRNQTDNTTVVENYITNNWTVGVLFLDGSGGTNSPVQTALNSTFSNNNISANWYAQVVDRQNGGALPVPGTTNLKNCKGNWFGVIVPVVTTANSANPGYAALIPVAYGGTAIPPGGQPDIAGSASANLKYEPQLLSGTDTNVETTSGRGTFGFQGVANVPILSIADHTFTGVDSLGAAEGFTVTLLGETNQTVTVHYQTSEGSAIAGQDYTAASGTLIFNPGETSKTIPVNILPDTTQEPTEQFFIDLSDPINSGILARHAVGTIPNDDAAPTFAVGDVTHNEGNSGTTSYTFTIARTGSTALSSTVNYNTADGSASSLADYTAVSGSVVFGPADVTKQVTVLVSGDISYEGDETFTLHLSGTDNGTITDADGTGTIVNDDAPATVQFSAATYMEDESQSAAITITRTGDITSMATVDFATSNGAAVGGPACTIGVDFINTLQTVTFDPNDTSKIVNVPVCADTFPENTQGLHLALSNPSAPASLGIQATATLNINDTASQFRSNDPIVISNNAVSNPSTIDVSGAPVSSGSVRVTLYDLSHTNPEDLDILLVGPGGQKFILMGNAGGGNALNAVTLTFDDTAFQVLPNSNAIATGKYEPTTWISPVAGFTSPAPAGPYSEPGNTLGGFSLRNIFGASNPNGTWNLYIRDRGSVSPLAPEGLGAVAGGWGLEFLAPTAATASVSGRILTADGRPIANVRVNLAGGGLPQTRSVFTGQLGYYYFSDLPVGQNYVVTVKSRRFTFADPSHLVTLLDNLADQDFIADPQE